jgi:hypothetical protein
MSTCDSPMLRALWAPGPDEALASKLRLYGQFVGSWRLDVDFDFADGTHLRVEGEAIFDWVLDGRAVQDLFIVPSRRLRMRSATPQPWWRFGSTFRWYDPIIDAWHITFFDPPRRVEQRQIGRLVGDEIVQVGEADDGSLWRRWRFTDIGDTSFVWLGEVSWDKGATWRLELRMAASRRAD